MYHALSRLIIIYHILLPGSADPVFSFLTGKMTRKYDESLAAIQEMQQAGTAVYRVEDMEFGRRLAVEKEIELPGPDGKVPGAWINAVWDESGAFVLYPTLLGIKGKPSLRSALLASIMVYLLSYWRLQL